jgi:Tfp pilus assembly protein PilV
LVNHDLKLNRRGMSMITVLVALVVMALGMMGVANVFLKALRSNGSAGGVTELMNLADRTGDALLMMPDNAVPMAAALTSLPSGDICQYDMNKYDVKYQIVNTPLYSGDTHTVRMVVEVDYNYASGHGKLTGGDTAGESKIRLVTYRYRD